MDEQLLAGQVPAADTASETPETPPTVTVVDVHFRSGGKNYYFDPRDLPIETGDHLIIETAQGMEFGYCSAGAHAVSAREIVPPLRAVIRIATEKDEQLLADSIAEVLRRKGFEAEAVYDGETGAEYAELGVYDLLILDVMMPGLDGYTVARQVRARHLGTPILMLTARSGLEDRITGLNAGADYYLTKPFDTRELLACVNALLRRQGAQVNQLTLGNTSLDLSTAALSCGADSIRLSAREFDIMRLLLQAGERNLSKAALLERVWGYDSDAVENHVEVYVCFLRKKLASIGSNIRIESIRRLGYHLEVSGDD